MSNATAPAILLVEDEALIALAEGSVLERAGYRVVIARTGEDAVVLARSDESIALVLMDIDLGPGIDGPTAAEQILSMRDVPLAFLSSHTEPEIVDRTEGITSYGYIVKNTGNTVLLASIRMAFRLHAAQAELLRQKRLLKDALAREEHASEQFREKSDELDRYFDASLDMLCIASTDGRLLRLNPEWERTLGHPVSDLLGQRFMDFVHPDDRDATTTAFARLRDQQIIEGFESRYRCADGSYRWIEWRSKPLGSTVYAAARDVTDRRQALDALRDSERRERAFLANSPLLMSEIGPDGLYRWVNTALAAAVGLKPGDLFGRPFGDVLPRELADTFAGRVARVRENHAAVQIDDTIGGPDGERHFVTTLFPLFADDGELSSIGAIAHDVTERDRAATEEARFNSLQRLLISLAVRLVSGSPGDADGAILGMLREVGEFTGVDRTYVFAHDYEQGVTKNTYEWCADGIRPEIDNLQAIPLESIPTIVHAHRRGDAFVVARVAALPDDDPVRQILEPQNVQSVLLLPLLRDGQSVGMVGFDAVRTERVFPDALIDLLKVLAALIVAIHERRDTEASLQSERTRLRGIIDGTNVGTWEWNVQSGQTVFNERWAGIVGYSLDEIAPVSIATWERFAHPDDLAESTRRLEEHFVGSADFYEVEIRMRHRDGRWVWVQDRGQVVTWTADGKPLLMMGTHQDITDRKEAERVLREREERFRSLLDRIESVPVQAFSRDGIVHYWNAASAELYGYAVDEVIGANVVDLLIPEEMRETVRGRIRTMADTVDAIPPTEDWIRRKDGSLVRVMTSHAVVRLPGRDPEVFCLDFDVSQRYAAQERVAELARERETLLKEVQHRIKNNMNTMVGLLTLQAAAIDNADASAALNDAVGRFKSMEVLYDQLYRTDDHRHASVARYTEQLVEKVVRLFPAGANLHPAVSAEEFTLDARRLSTYGLIVNELVTNAMKYAFVGSSAPELSVSVRRDADRVRLIVRDNGPGFPEALSAESSVHDPSTDAATSSFGLTMVGALTEQLGGTLRLESDHGALAIVEFDA